ncbi:hypothetical protein [Streptomyces sp. NPDC005435]|uniref:hypothetical protein n=1 Tax=Streptomyces sp. NPDC005435 TaxID=3154464 RepID=UPI0034545E7A
MSENSEAAETTDVTESVEATAEKPPLYRFLLHALMLTAGLVGVWCFTTWWSRVLAGIVIVGGLNASINLAHAERKAHEAGIVRNTRRPTSLFLYAVIVALAALVGAIFR